MIKKFQKIFSSWALVFLFTPAVALASGPGDFFGLNSIKQLFCSGGGPACSETLPDLIVGVINLLLLCTGGLAVLFLIIGGYFYITSGGNEEQAQRGRKTITDAIIGLVVVLLSYSIVNVIINTLGGRT